MMKTTTTYGELLMSERRVRFHPLDQSAGMKRVASTRAMGLNGLLAGAFALLLSGCVTNATLPTPASAPSVIDYVRDLEKVTSTLLDKVVVALPSPATDHPDFTEWGSFWC